MTPIRTLETRFPRIGYISVGHQVVSKKDASKVHPVTTDTLTIHAKTPTILEPFAALYGGEVVESPTSTEAQERWFVVTQAAELPVMVPADLDIAYSQWYETWASSGLVRRCDGVDCVLWRRPPEKDEKVGSLSDAMRPCMCDEDGKEERMCKPTVRLSVVPIEVAGDIPEIGVFTVRSTGFFTNSELKGDLELIRSVIGHLGAGVPLKLCVEQTRTRRGNKPKLRLSLGASPNQIAKQIAAGTRPMLAAPIVVDVEQEEAVGAFVVEEASGAEASAGHTDNLEEPEHLAPAPDVVNVFGVDVPYRGGTQRGGDVIGAPSGLVTQMKKLAKQIDPGFDLLIAFVQFAGFDLATSSLETAQAFSDWMRDEIRARAA